MEQQQVPQAPCSRPSYRFLSSTVLASSPGYWVQVHGFPVLGSWAFAEVLLCTVLLSRFPARSQVGEVLVECFKILWLTKAGRMVEWVIWLKSSWAAIIELRWETSRLCLIFPQLKHHADLMPSCQQNGRRQNSLIFAGISFERKHNFKEWQTTEKRSC